MEMFPLKGRKKGVPDSGPSVTGCKKSVWIDERGAILVPVIVLTSVAFLVVTMAISMIPAHQKEALFIQQKLSKDILEYGITQIVKIPQNCTCLLTGQTINKALKNPPALTLSEIKTGGCGGDVLVSPGNDMGYGMKIKSIEVNNLDQSGTSKYVGELTVSYDHDINIGNLFRAIAPVKVPIEIIVGAGTGVQSISSCHVIVTGDVLNKRNGGCVGSQQGSTHDNGGGFVASTATVASTAYVGRDASVCDTAKVLESARIEDSAIVTDNSKVYGHAKISGKAEIRRGSEVFGHAQVSNLAVVSHESKVSERAKISGMAKIVKSTVTDDAIIKESARIVKSTVSGKSEVAGWDVSVEKGAVINGGGSDPDWKVTVSSYSRVIGATVSGGASVFGASANEGTHVYEGAQVSGATQVSGDVPRGTQINSGTYP